MRPYTCILANAVEQKKAHTDSSLGR